MNSGLKEPILWIIILIAILSTVFYKKIRGFMGEFWLKTELNKLKTSAKNVATEYSKDAATAALNQDSNLTTIKSNT